MAQQAYSSTVETWNREGGNTDAVLGCCASKLARGDCAKHGKLDEHPRDTTSGYVRSTDCGVTFGSKRDLRV